MFPLRYDPIAWWSRTAPDRVALVDRARGGRLTYRELDMAADRWAGLLAGVGVHGGDRVAALTGNRHETVALFYGALRTGAVLVPLNWRLANPELARVFANARVSLIVGEGRYRDRSEAAAGAGVRWLDVDVDVPPLLQRAAGMPGNVRHTADDPALMLYTSGSTGEPKGAVLPMRQLFYNAVATTVGWELGASDVGPVATPNFHTGGWNVFATPLWHVGGRVVLFDQFDPTEYLRGIADERCSVALTIPTQMAMMLESPAWGVALPSLRFFISGGAPCPQSVFERVRAAGYSMKEGYGLTECGPNCFAITLEDALRRPGSVGWPAPYLDARLLTDDGRDAAPNEAGELLLRGPQRFSGYFRDPPRTADAIDANGWLRTGDLASRDADGAFRICGRRKEMFISGGENVFPGEVEAVLSEHNGVAEAIVVGVADARWGEVGRAFVVPRRGHELEPTTLLSFARERLAGYKVPKSLVVLVDLPRLGSGKPDRRALAALAHA